MKVADLDPDRTVYVYRTSPDSVHTRADCSIGRKYDEHERAAKSLNQDIGVCKFCTGEAQEKMRGGSSDGDQTAYQALLYADPDDVDWGE